MPVVRISDVNWERLKMHARPLEDSVDDVIAAALNALDKDKGIHTLVRKPRSKEKPKNKRKLPQKEFRIPLMKLLRELGGAAEVSKIRRMLEPIIQPKLGDADYDLVSSGDPRWWNAVCWERNDLVKEGLFRQDSPRGEWALSETGQEYLRTI